MVRVKVKVPQIPMNNTTARIVSMLGISGSSLLNLKKETKAVRELGEAKKKKK
jgi:hypothetical protein